MSDVEVFEYDGDFLPAKLAGELEAAGLETLGVTATADDEGQVEAVQVIVPEGTAKPAVDAVVAAHNPAPRPPSADELNRKAIADALTAQMAALQQIIAGVNSGVALTGAQRDNALKALALGQRRLIRYVLNHLEATD